MIFPLDMSPLSSLPAEVEAVVLFGSRARGDSDAASDTDIGVFANAEQFEDLTRVKDACASAYALLQRVNVSVYSTRTAERLAAHGSLFLWHVRLEAEILFARSHWLDRLLNEELAAYDTDCAWRDLETFLSVSREVESALLRSETTLLFEAATLFAVLRGVGMIIGIRHGQPSFARLEPIHRLRARIHDAFPLTDAEIAKLEEAKLVYSGRLASNWRIAPLALREQAAKVTALLEKAFDVVH